VAAGAAAKTREAEGRLGELGRAEAARIREEQRAAAERRLRNALSTEARNWEEAPRVRSYVQWVQGTVGEARTLSLAGIGESAATWVEWALKVAEELDPTFGRRRQGTRASFSYRPQ